MITTTPVKEIITYSFRNSVPLNKLQDVQLLELWGGRAGTVVIQLRMKCHCYSFFCSGATIQIWSMKFFDLTT